MKKYNLYFYTDGLDENKIDKVKVEAESKEAAIEKFLVGKKQNDFKEIVIYESALFPVSESYPNPLFKKDVAEVDLNFLNENYTSKSANSSASSIKQYKVMTQKDKWYSPNFDPERLEQALNAYAKEGWVVKSICTAQIAGFGGNREELIVVFER